MLPVNWRVKKRVPTTWLTDVLAVFEKNFKVSASRLSITVVGQSQIRKLNRIYRHQDKPTNVLSFPLKEKEILGEVVLCLPLIKKEAKRLRRPVKEYLQYILIHGLLHLLAMDHKTAAQTKKMESAEAKLLKGVLNQL